MNYKSLIDSLVKKTQCAKRDLFDLVDHDLRHLGLNESDYLACLKELKVFIDNMKA